MSQSTQANIVSKEQQMLKISKWANTIFSVFLAGVVSSFFKLSRGSSFSGKDMTYILVTIPAKISSDEVEKKIFNRFDKLHIYLKMFFFPPAIPVASKPTDVTVNNIIRLDDDYANVVVFWRQPIQLNNSLDSFFVKAEHYEQTRIVSTDYSTRIYVNEV